MKELVRMIAVAIWIAGIIIAKGFWSTFFAVIIPFWSWYLVVEKVMIHYGVI